MKFVYIFVICSFAIALAQAQLTASGGGSRSKGFDINVDAQKKVWQSQNKRHSVDAAVGYSQHVGGKYGSSKPDYRAGVQYKYKF